MAVGNRLGAAGKGSSRPLVMFLGLRGVGGIQGGVETHVAELARHLPFPPERMEVLGRSPYRRADVPADPSLPITRWLPAPRQPALEALFHSVLGVFYAALRRPALLHIHGIGPGMVTPLARLLGLRVVATHHGKDYEREKWGPLARRMLRWGERQAVLRSNAVVCISPVCSAELRSSYHRDVAYVPNGVDLLRPVPPGATLARHGLAAGRYIVNVARIVPEKRQLDLIEAFQQAGLPDDVRLVLIGGADHEADYVREVRKAAAQDPRVVLAGHMAGAPLAELFSNAGLFVLPSTHEGLPIALLEAMSYGRALLLSDLPVYRAMGLPEDCLFPVGDTGELARRLGAAFAPAPLPVDWSAALDAYRWDEVARRTAAVYADVLEHG